MAKYVELEKVSNLIKELSAKGFMTEQTADLIVHQELLLLDDIDVTIVKEPPKLKVKLVKCLNCGNEVTCFYG